MSPEYVEYICVFDTVHDVMVDTSHPGEMDPFREHEGKTLHIMDTLHRVISSHSGGVFDLPHVSQTTHSYCPCYPLTMYYGHVPWTDTPFVIHFLGIDEVESCEDTNQGVYTTIYVVITRSGAPPVNTMGRLLSNLRPTHTRLIDLLQNLGNHSRDNGKDVLRGWLSTMLRSSGPDPVPATETLGSKRTILVTSAVIVAISTLYLVFVSFG